MFSSACLVSDAIPPCTNLVLPAPIPNWPERYKTDPARTAAENGKGRVDGRCSSVGSMFDYSRKGDNVTHKYLNLTYSSV